MVSRDPEFVLNAPDFSPETVNSGRSAAHLTAIYLMYLTRLDTYDKAARRPGEGEGDGDRWSGATGGPGAQRSLVSSEFMTREDARSLSPPGRSAGRTRRRGYGENHFAAATWDWPLSYKDVCRNDDDVVDDNARNRLVSRTVRWRAIYSRPYLLRRCTPLAHKLRLSNAFHGRKSGKGDRGTTAPQFRVHRRTLTQIVPPPRFCYVWEFQAPDCLQYNAVKRLQTRRLWQSIHYFQKYIFNVHHVTTSGGKFNCFLARIRTKI